MRIEQFSRLLNKKLEKLNHANTRPPGREGWRGRPLLCTTVSRKVEQVRKGALPLAVVR